MDRAFSFRKMVWVESYACQWMGTTDYRQVNITPLGLAVHGINEQTGLYKYICNGPLGPRNGTSQAERLPTSIFQLTTVELRPWTWWAICLSPPTAERLPRLHRQRNAGLCSLLGLPNPRGWIFGRRGLTVIVSWLRVCSRYSDWHDFSDLDRWDVTPFVTGAGMPNYMVFETVSATPLPVVVTGVASNVGDTTATLNGTVNPSGSETTYQFQYGLTTAYGSTTTSTSAGNGFTAVPVSAALTGLIPGTLYHFRVTATNSGGTANGVDATFTASSIVRADASAHCCHGNR